MHAKSLQSCPILCDPMDCIACLAPLSMEFYKQECWSGLPFPLAGDLPDPRIKPRSPALQADYCLNHKGSPTGISDGEQSVSAA